MPTVGPKPSDSQKRTSLAIVSCVRNTVLVVFCSIRSDRGSQRSSRASWFRSEYGTHTDWLKILEHRMAAQAVGLHPFILSCKERITVRGRGGRGSSQSEPEPRWKPDRETLHDWLQGPKNNPAMQQEITTRSFALLVRYTEI